MTKKKKIDAKSNFWEEKSLDEMNQEEWESLCDRCGKCCLVLLRDEDTNEIHETDIACRLYDVKNRRCCDYNNRHTLVPDCIQLTPQKARTLDWLPGTCAYRRLANSQPLPMWHPLITKNPMSVIEAGIATSQNLLSEENVKDEDLTSRVRGLRR